MRGILYTSLSDIKCYQEQNRSLQAVGTGYNNRQPIAPSSTLICREMKNNSGTVIVHACQNLGANSAFSQNIIHQKHTLLQQPFQEFQSVSTDTHT